MIWTEIVRATFSWDEYNEMTQFEKDNQEFRKISESTMGTTYEYRTDHILNMKRKEE